MPKDFPMRSFLARTTILTLVAGSVLGASAPGSTAKAKEAARLTPWMRDANEICAKVQIDVVDRLQKRKINPSDPKSAMAAFTIAEGVYKQQIANFRKLNIDEDSQKKVDKMLSSLEDALKKRRETLEKKKEEKKNPFEDPTKKASELGLSCRF